MASRLAPPPIDPTFEPPTERPSTLDHPTAAWSAQQVVDAFPDDTAPHWMHRDRDRVSGDLFQRRLASMGIAEVVSAPGRPWQNPYVKRLIGSVRRECLNM